jgi:hypothetical protein
MGNELSRRDDIESLGYILIYLAKGFLPWQDLQIFEKDKKYSKIKSSKETVKSETLCKGLPNQFKQYFDYSKILEFEDKPDYSYLRDLFMEILKTEKSECDWKYDWVKDHLKIGSRLGSNSRLDSGKKPLNIKVNTPNIQSSTQSAVKSNSVNNKTKSKIPNQLSVLGSALGSLDTSKQALQSLNTDYDFENIDEYEPAIKSMSFVFPPKFLEKIGSSHTLISNAPLGPSSFNLREKITNWAKDEENLTFDDDEIRRGEKIIICA